MHLSIGVFAVVTILVGDTVDGYCKAPDVNMTMNGTDLTCGSVERIDVAVALTMAVGIVQLLMFVVRLGFITIFLSDPLVGGFTTGAAFLVGTSQLKHVFGLDFERQSGIFSVPKTWKEIFAHLGDTNGATFLISLCCIAFLVIVKIVNTKYHKKLKFPIPGELIVIILGAGISYGGKFHEKFDVKIVTDIPSGLPTPSLPNASLVGYMLRNQKTYILAVVSYGLTISMCKLFAKQFKYKLGMNQELFAYSLTNIVGSFFSCVTVSGSLTRTVVYATVGGRTLLGSVFSALIVLIVLVAVAPLFEPLPNAVLAAVVLVALRGLLMQFRDVKKLFYVNKLDLGLWLVTFFATVIFSVDIGLAVGVIYGILTIVWHSFVPYQCLLGRIPGTDLYRDLSRFEAIQSVPGVKIFRFESSLSFANSERFKRKLLSFTDIDLSNTLQAEDVCDESNRHDDDLQQKQTGSVDMSHDDTAQSASGLRLRCLGSLNESSLRDDTIDDDVADAEASPSLQLSLSSHIPTHTVIIDCTVFTFMDSVSVNMIVELNKDLQECGIQLLLAGCRWRVRQTLEAGGYMAKVGLDHLFVTIHDAVVFALHGASLVTRPRSNNDDPLEDVLAVSEEEPVESQADVINVVPQSDESSV